VYDDVRAEFTEARILQGDGMRAGQEVGGPAIVEREDTTIHILAGQTGLLDERGCLVIRSERGSL
jgi:N-methylhydantoinase A/oxoprolinase/acetone carboxylase beta subunit